MMTFSRIKRAVQARIYGFNRYKFDHVCWIKTIMYNWLWFGCKGLRKLPIWIYNDVQILANDEMVIVGEMHSGMIKMGVWKPKANSKTRWINNSKVVFYGDAIIRGGTTFENTGVVEIGKNVLLSESSRVMCERHITFGDNVSLGFESIAIDTDFHFVLNVHDMTVQDNKKSIYIGAGSWIAGYSKVMKGTVLPPCSIVASCSMVNMDYSKEAPNTIFAGAPAKPIKTGYRRIHNVAEEWNLNQKFPIEGNIWHIETNDIDKYCTDNFSKK